MMEYFMERQEERKNKGTQARKTRENNKINFKAGKKLLLRNRKSLGEF